MNEIYLAISLSTHNGDDTPQNQKTVFFNTRRVSKDSELVEKQNNSLLN